MQNLHYAKGDSAMYMAHCGIIVTPQELRNGNFITGLHINMFAVSKCYI